MLGDYTEKVYKRQVSAEARTSFEVRRGSRERRGRIEKRQREMSHILERGANREGGRERGNKKIAQLGHLSCDALITYTDRAMCNALRSVSLRFPYRVRYIARYGGSRPFLLLFPVPRFLRAADSSCSPVVSAETFFIIIATKRAFFHGTAFIIVLVIATP